MAQAKHEQRMAAVLAEIAALQPRLVRVIDALRIRDRDAFPEVNAQTFADSVEYMRFMAFLQASIKLRIMVEQNFSFLHTFSVLATTRYVLELLIWFRLLIKDANTYGYFFYAFTTVDQVNYLESQIREFKREISFFRDLDSTEKDQHETVLSSIRGMGGKLDPIAINESMDMVSAEIDRAARRNFSIHFEEAKYNGFGFQAALIEAQALPQLERELESQNSVRDSLKDRFPKWPKKWNWKIEAANAGLSEQFDFIYGYTSRLLHAHPGSFNTDQKNLEVSEMVLFLDFVYVSMLEMIEICERTAGIADPAVH
ncbi:MAG: hypothetical protein U1E28_21480 [Beijerinckiaceae bacterium]